MEDEVLKKKSWYLGELSKEAARDMLKRFGGPNTFVVFKCNDSYFLSVRCPVEGDSDDLIETLTIISTEEGMYHVSGQKDPCILCSSVTEAVNWFTSNRDPPLLPGLGNKDQPALHLSTSEPPEYDEANKQLQPDFTPLPSIHSITPPQPVENKIGYTFPTDSNIPHIRVPTPPYMHNPHWWRYRDKSCCHPRNVCHFLWYRDTRWNGYHGNGEEYRRHFCDCRNSGPLRCLLLVLMWLFGWPFILCGVCCAVSVFMFLLCFCQDKRPS